LFGAIALGYWQCLPIIGQVYLAKILPLAAQAYYPSVCFARNYAPSRIPRFMVTYDQYEAPEYFHGEDESEDQAAKKRRFLRKPSLRIKRKTK
jgi:hypothetical protein